MLELCTASRLHFGLIELAADQPHRFGGMGLMVQWPSVRLRAGIRTELDSALVRPASPTDENSEIRQRIDRAIEHARQALNVPPTSAQIPSLQDWTVQAIELPTMHSGLGVGTQLAAAVAACVQLEAGCDPRHATAHSQLVLRAADPDGREFNVARQSESIAATGEDRLWVPYADRFGQVAGHAAVQALATISARGKRSAIGLHGFVFGGLVQDQGLSITDRQDEPTTIGRVGPRTIATRSTAFPDEWPVVLITSHSGGDVFGAIEENLMEVVGNDPNPDRDRMLELSEACMSAATDKDFFAFVAGLESYMALAAALFESVQSGRYRNRIIASLAAQATDCGLRGVGQSSWGPTVFGFAPSLPAARLAAARLNASLDLDSLRVTVTQAANHGARWRRLPPWSF